MKWIYAVPDNQFDFLAKGETLTFTYHVTATVTYNGVPEQRALDLTVVITGTNDQPIITTDQQIQKIAFSGGTGTSGGPLITGDATSGTLAFTDVDLTDTHTVSAALTSITLVGPDGLPIDPTAFLAKNPPKDFHLVPGAPEFRVPHAAMAEAPAVNAVEKPKNVVGGGPGDS